MITGGLHWHSWHYSNNRRSIDVNVVLVEPFLKLHLLLISSFANLHPGASFPFTQQLPTGRVKACASSETRDPAACFHIASQGSVIHSEKNTVYPLEFRRPWLVSIALIDWRKSMLLPLWEHDQFGSLCLLTSSGFRLIFVPIGNQEDSTSKFCFTNLYKSIVIVVQDGNRNMAREGLI